jgi:hypothetical protein
MDTATGDVSTRRTSRRGRTDGDRCAVSLHGRTVTDVPTEDHTKVRSLRSDASVWEPFGEAVGDGNRSLWLNDFMRAVSRNAELWQDVRTITARRGTEGDVFDLIEAALSRYRHRHRDLLDAPQTRTERTD